EMLRRLSGRRHEVITAYHIRLRGAATERAVTTAVTFRLLAPAEIEAYVASGEWRGKAGGDAGQGIAALFAVGLRGSPTNVLRRELRPGAARQAASAGGHRPALALHRAVAEQQGEIRGGRSGADPLAGHDRSAERGEPARARGAGAGVPGPGERGRRAAKARR